MDKFDRIYDLHRILSGQRTVISMQRLMQELGGCDKSTVHRLIALMRDRMGAPIALDKERGGYHYQPLPNGRQFELPGLWFSGSELQALMVLQQLLASLGPGLLEEHLAPISKRLSDLLQHRRLNLSQAAQRIRTPAMAARPVGEAFHLVASATLQRRQLKFQYHSRGKDEHSQRSVAPQRVTHYRESWFLDAWDENKAALRSFAIDRISQPEIQQQPCRDIPEPELDQHYATGYGIFGGKPDKQAVLHFTAERARWVADEQWHPQQQTAWLQDGRYELRIPYSDARELVMDILRHGPHVEVVEPKELRAEIAGVLKQALRQY